MTGDAEQIHGANHRPRTVFARRRPTLNVNYSEAEKTMQMESKHTANLGSEAQNKLIKTSVRCVQGRSRLPLEGW